MTIENGEFIADDTQAIEKAMMNTARNYFGEDLNDDQVAVIRLFLRPIARELHQLQQDIGLVLASSQVDNATGEALDLLCSLIGVPRKEAEKATGTSVFTRSSPASKDYPVPVGTAVQTDSINPIRFHTEEKAVISGPDVDSDSSLYSTTSGTFVTKTSFTVDVTYREKLDVKADFRTTDGTVTAYLEVADATNATTIQSDSTTNTSFTTSGPITYDVSGLTGDVTIEYRIKNSDGATSVELDNSTLDKGGETGTEAPVIAEDGGTESNLGANTLTVMPDAPTGVENTNNPVGTSGGEDREPDDQYRERAKKELADGSAATAAALISGVRGVEGVRDVTILINDTDTDNNYGNGLPSHSFELIVLTDDASTQEKVGQKILDTKAAGDMSVSGQNGTAVTISGDLPNGQTHEIGYSEPTSTQIYVDVDLVKTSEYAGDSELRDNIIEYIGGILSDGSDYDGTDVGEDIIYTQVQKAVMNTSGVWDINSLYTGTSSSPTGTSNIAIGSTEVGVADANDGSITISKNNK